MTTSPGDDLLGGAGVEVVGDLGRHGVLFTHSRSPASSTALASSPTYRTYFRQQFVA